MAKIENKNFIGPDFGQPAIDALKEILKLSDQLVLTLRKVGDESEDVLEGLDPKNKVKDVIELNKQLEKLTEAEKDLNKATEDNKKITEDLAKAEAQKLKLEKEALVVAQRESKLRQEKQKELLAEQKVQQQIFKNSVAETKERERQQKLREREAKQREKLNSLYSQESARLNTLRKRYKELALAEKENTDEAKDLLKEITALDKKLKDLDKTVGQNQRNVGAYEKAVEGLNNTLGKFQAAAGVFAAVAGALAFLGDAFASTREGSLELQILFSKFTETTKVLVQNLINSGEGFKNLFSAVFDTFAIELRKAERDFLNFQRTFQKGLEFVGVSGAADEVKRLESEIDNVNSTIEELEKSSVSDSIDQIAKAFENTADTTSRAIQEQEKFLRLQLETRISIQQQERALAGLAEQRQILQDISDDDTIGFLTRTKAIKDAQDAALEFAQLENKLALDREKLTIEAVKQDLRRSKSLNETELNAIRTGEQLLKILQNNDLARKVSDENDEAFTQAFVDRRSKEVEAEAFRRDQEEKNRLTARDEFEQDLDIFEEFTEKRIAENQKIIDSDTSSLGQRQKALRENQKLEQELFENSIDRIFTQAKASIDLRKEAIEGSKILTDQQKQEQKQELEKQKTLLTTINIQEILNAENEKERLNLIRRLDLGEVEERRLKETLKIRQDVAIANEEASKTEDGAIERTLQLKEEVLIQEKKLQDESFDLQQAEIDNQKKNLQEQIDLAEEGSIKQLELQKELNELRLEEQQKANEKEEEETKKSAERRADAIQTAAELATNFIEKQNEKRLQNIDDTLNATLERQNALRAAAEQGNEEAVKSLAESEKQEAEIRAERERELQRQQRIEAGLAAFQVFAANAQEDPGTALSRTFTDITALTAFISSLPAFFEGTEDTGTVSNPLDSNGGRVAILHNHERVITAKDNKKIGNISNEELTRIAVEYKRGTFQQFEQVSSNQVPVIFNQQQESIKKELNEILKATIANKPTDPIPSFDKRTKVYSEMFKEGNRNVRNHKKIFVPKDRN